MSSLEQRKGVKKRQPGVFRLGVVLLSLIFFISILWSWWRTDGSVVLSQDQGAQSAPLFGMVIAAGVTLVIVRFLPLKLHSAPPLVKDPLRSHQDLIVLLSCAVIFPFTAFLPGPAENFIIWKVVLLILLPALYLRRRSHSSSIKIIRPSPDYPLWVLALVPVILYVTATQVGPLAPAAPTGWPDLLTLAIASIITALTAGVGEELFYRYWLQSRLEAVAGRWFGILLVSLVYGLMHLGTHGAGLSLDVGVTTVIASQGVFGLLLGYLWSRYRIIWICIVLHIMNNGMLVFLHILGFA